MSLVKLAVRGDTDLTFRIFRGTNRKSNFKGAILHGLDLSSSVSSSLASNRIDMVEVTLPVGLPFQWPRK